MASIGLNVVEFEAQLEADGVDKVRRDMASGIYSLKVGEKGAIVQDWLLRKEQIAARASAALANELQTRGVTAAERQATAAEKATRIAWLALVVSAVAAILSVIALRQGH